MPGFLALFAIGFVVGVIMVALRPRPKPPEIAKFERPRVGEGEELPVVFGVCEVGPNITWYGNLTETKREIDSADYIAYRGQMLGALAHGVLDRLIDIRFGDYSIRNATPTKHHAPVLSQSLPYERPVGGEHLELFIQAPELYGGPTQQGGPVGLIHLHWGTPDDVICELTRHVLKLASARPGEAYVAIGWAPEPEGEDVFDEADWTLVEDYGGSFSFNGTTAVMNGLWSVGIGGGNGVLEIQRTWTGLDPDEVVTVRLRCRHTLGTFNDFFSLRLLPGAVDVEISQDFYDGVAGGSQVLVVRAKPSALGELGVAIGASGIEFGDSNYEMQLEAFSRGFGPAEENYGGPYWQPTPVGAVYDLLGGNNEPDPSDGLFEFCMNSPVPPEMVFVVQRTPLGVTNEHIGLGANAADAIYEIATNAEYGLGKPASRIDTADFAASGATLAAEGVGLHFLMTRAREAGEWIEDILAHVDGFAFTDPETALFRFRLARADYDVEDLPVLTGDMVRNVVVERPDLGQLLGEVKVRYRRLDGAVGGDIINEPLTSSLEKGFYHRYQSLGRKLQGLVVRQGVVELTVDVDYKVDLINGIFWFPTDGGATAGQPVTISYTTSSKYKTIGFSDAVQQAQNLATIQAQGSAARSETIEFPMFGSDVVAQRAASRLIRAQSRKLATVRFDASRAGGLLRPGDVVVLDDPENGADQLVVRVLTVNWGTVREPWQKCTGIEDKFADDTPIYLPDNQGDDDFTDGQRQAPRPAGLVALDPSSISLALYSADPAFDFELKIADDEDETNATTVEIDGAETTYEDVQVAGTTKSYWLRHVAEGWIPSEWIGPVTYTAEAGVVPAPAVVLPTVTEVPSDDGVTGTLGLTIVDPQHRVVAVEFATKAGTAAETALAEDASPYEAEVAFVAGMQSHIRYRVTYRDAEGDEAVIENTVVFNDQAAEPTFTTADDETASLPNSRQWENGDNTTVDLGTNNKISINLTGIIPAARFVGTPAEGSVLAIVGGVPTWVPLIEGALGGFGTSFGSSFGQD